ncbi:MAG: hypothetical protein KA120_04995 [Candidatus Goldbacteria bacterium]|nr:hypothetical protein [Candidatus Goldiibacteriota bacterium]
MNNEINENIKCKFCDSSVKIISAINFVKEVDCLICGNYKISFKFSKIQTEIEKRHLISGYIRNNQEIFKNKIIEEDVIKKLEKELIEPDINEQINMILEFYDKNKKYKGDYIELKLNCDFSLFYCKNYKELFYILDQILKMDLITSNSELNELYTEQFQFKLTYKGIQRLYEIKKRNKESLKCFVAMSFEDEYDDIFTEGIQKIFEEDEDLKRTEIKPYRVDKDLKNSNDQTIVNKIIAGIKTSRFFIADLTGNNHNVYFETGYAMGFNIPVILICQEDYFNKEKIKFDLSHHSFILYKDISDLKEKLSQAIKANIF